MTLENKWLHLLTELRNAVEISPKSGKVIVELGKIEPPLSRIEHTQMFSRLSHDNLLDIEWAPDEMNDNHYVLHNVDLKELVDLYDEYHFISASNPKNLSADNFLAVADVCSDMAEQLQIHRKDVVEIPILQPIIKFPRLLPQDGIGQRDRYCELRVKAVNYLLESKKIKAFKFTDDFHRWEKKIVIQLDRMKFDIFYKEFLEIYEKRVKSDTKEAKPSRAKNPSEGLGNSDWSTISIRFLDGHEVELIINGTKKNSDYKEMGFNDQKQRLPNIQWQILRHMADNHGFISFDQGFTKDLKSQKKELKKKLCDYFKISDDPFNFVNNCYEAKFELISEKRAPASFLKPIDELGGST